ncbi:MAG TPA: hypothetical protein ENK37_04875 [Oceanithermus profundus]|uniref:Outer membrane protein beta-barrel domain-containing protein n=1 Tax=Oceanithermus profundus TaxID=187137 RepID=A0A7C4Z503_9DEIN|nr:hypothetical protein [Oceanithermus profundus]
MKRAAAVVLLLAGLLQGCAPGAIVPTPAYEGEGVSAGIYPSSTRAGHTQGDGFLVHMGPLGLGLEIARGPWRGTLYGGYSGAAGRVSWEQDEVGLSLDAAYNSSITWREVDTDDDGIPDTQEDVQNTFVGAALDGSYYFAVPTEFGEAYAGPRGRLYFACEQTQGAAYRCNRYGLLPGGTLGINVPLSVFSDRLVLGFEGSVFFVVPGITDRPRFSVFSPFALSLSYRF